MPPPAPWTIAPVTITKYERARAIGTRAAQIGANSRVHVDVTDLDDSLAMATREFRAGKCPLFVRRYYPDHTAERPHFDDHAAATMRDPP